MPKRPPKHWFKRCVKAVKKSSPHVTDPNAICGQTWYHRMSPAAKKRALAEEKRLLKKRDSAGGGLLDSIVDFMRGSKKRAVKRKKSSESTSECIRRLVRGGYSIEEAVRLCAPDEAGRVSRARIRAEARRLERRGLRRIGKKKRKLAKMDWEGVVTKRSPRRTSKSSVLRKLGSEYESRSDRSKSDPYENQVAIRKELVKLGWDEQDAAPVVYGMLTSEGILGTMPVARAARAIDAHTRRVCERIGASFDPPREPWWGYR